ncbi:hypothetical protein F8M41_020656 [Gigaspora margarita]|uniref:Uncharacterized protein n=1 Tax=Gigaspora margarita TaxID=4874 RepID=A0A8H4AHZ3_GIGMA|nr:hypothetical protein F8M41_020656 [Gigaspora margarita]
MENFKEEQEDQKDLPEDLKETKKELKDNDSNNVKKEPVRKHKNILKKFGKLYKRPRMETSKIKQKNQKELLEDLNEAKNELEDNNFTSSIASSFSSSDDDDNDSKKEINKNNK